MGTPFYHTDESALETIEQYAELQGMTFDEALADMEFCQDELDSEDRSAYNHYINNRSTK
jgi:hypothetical protein